MIEQASVVVRIGQNTLRQIFLILGVGIPK
jgi:hypothetical protein